MKRLLDIKRLPSIVGWTFLVLLLLLLALEGWRYGIKPSQSSNEQVIELSLERASNYFVQQQHDLLANSRGLSATLRPALLQNQSSRYLYNILNQFSGFWSIALYREGDPIVWKGFALQNQNQIPISTGRRGESSIRLKKDNNVIYWQAYLPFSIQDSTGTTSYDLLTTYRVEQDNPLPIGDRSEYNLFNSASFSTTYPLDYSLFSPAPQDVYKSRTLRNLQADSVGVVYATANKFQQTQAKWERNTRFWRSVYALICFVAIMLILFWAADFLSAWTGLGLQLFFVLVGWTIFAYTNMPSYWILTLSDVTDTQWIHTVERLSSSFTNAIFFLLAASAISRKLNQLKYKIGADWYLTSIGFSVVIGCINAASLSLIFDFVKGAAINTGVSLLDLRIFPNLTTVILYLSIGLTLFAAGIILVSVNRLLFRVTKEHFKLSASVFSTSFVLALFVAQLLIWDLPVFNWIFYSSVVAFVIILGIASGFAMHWGGIPTMSPLRKVVLSSLFVSLVSLPLIYQVSLHGINKELRTTAQNFSQEEDPQAANLTGELLTTLEQNFRDITAADLQENRSTLQARFTQTIQNFLSPKWNAYSLDLQLINKDGELIADYATDLNSPNWLNIYNITTLKAVTEIEQITKSTIRPVVQMPQLVNQQDYRTFYRGWIPLFGSSEESPIAWILCSVYKERPEFNKPIRAVMASLTYDDWNTPYLMQKFRDGNLVKSVQQGFTGYFPKYRTLGNDRMQALSSDSLIYLTESSDDYTYRTLLWKITPGTTIKVSTTLPDYRVILFSFFRMSFTLLLLGCCVLLLGQLFTWGGIHFFGKEKRFQDRLLDSFLVATLLFMAFLIATSHYAIKQQNQDIVRQELVDKLESLSEAVESNRSLQEQRRRRPSLSLASLTTPFNVDATFYANLTVTETTTPQIYQQSLLPAVLPFQIYHQLFMQRKQDAYTTVKLAGQSLLIGYRSILSEGNHPVATIAIPTFLQSPKYDQQLLETTSYLILIYLLVFGLFILGSTFISRQLTRPLVYIQRGLNKISAGNLNTTIPVTSDDEIGNLAKAYNNMVSRLKKLQKELAEAEREAAWKEMAQQVAHEIKNPLTPMKLNVQHLERQLKRNDQDPEKLKHQVQKITNNLIEQIQTLNNIASDFSKFSQPLEKDFSRVNLSALMSSVAELYEHDENLSIHLQIPDKMVFVNGIEDELKRVMINLVKNAYEAMPEGGEIILRLYRRQRHVFIEVEDNGTGIAEENRSNIFVPNFSTKSSGTGLGLAICKKIIEAHDGSISFASVEGEGTTFVIKIPQANRM